MGEQCHLTFSSTKFNFRSMSDETGIERARFAAGGDKGRDIDIARLLGISPAAVSRWKGIVPPDRAIEIEEKSGGKVTRHQIRPDYFGPA